MKRVVILLVLLQVAALNANPLETMPEEIEVAELNANPLWNQTLPEELDSDEYEIHGDMIVKKVLRKYVIFKAFIRILNMAIFLCRQKTQEVLDFLP